MYWYHYQESLGVFFGNIQNGLDVIHLKRKQRCLSQNYLLKKNCIKTVSKWMSLYKWPLYDLFWPFFRHMYVHLSQNWGSDGHFEVLNRSYLWLVQKLWHKTQIFPFLFYLPLCTKTDVCLFCVFLRFCVFCHNFCTN